MRLAKRSRLPAIVQRLLFLLPPLAPLPPISLSLPTLSDRFLTPYDARSYFIEPFKGHPPLHIKNKGYKQLGDSVFSSGLIEGKFLFATANSMGALCCAGHNGAANQMSTGRQARLTREKSERVQPDDEEPCYSPGRGTKNTSRQLVPCAIGESFYLKTRSFVER